MVLSLRRDYHSFWNLLLVYEEVTCGLQHHFHGLLESQHWKEYQRPLNIFPSFDIRENYAQKFLMEWE